MWNKLSVVVFIAFFIPVSGVFPQDQNRDSVVVAPEEETHSPLRVFPENLSQFQRDSIIGVIPKDTSFFTHSRYFDGQLSEKYARDSRLNYERNINKSFLQKFNDAFSSLLRKLFGMGDASKIDNLTGKVLEVLLGLIFLAAVYLSVRLFMNYRGRLFFEKKNKKIPVNLSNVEKHIHEADFEALLFEAEQHGDTRQSVRLLYLWMLKVFTDRGYIRWTPGKTNLDYLVEIREKPLKEQFRYLSYLYNYIWYGAFLINAPEYRNVRETFLRHIKTAPEK